MKVFTTFATKETALGNTLVKYLKAKSKRIISLLNKTCSKKDRLGAVYNAKIHLKNSVSLVCSLQFSIGNFSAISIHRIGLMLKKSIFYHP